LIAEESFSTDQTFEIASRLNAPNRSRLPNLEMSPCKGEADQTIRGAEGYRFKRVNEAEGDVAALSVVLQQYVKAPEITRTRLYFETMSEILPQTGQKIIVDESMRRLAARSLREIVAKPGEYWSCTVN
jgi:regulator of protease activity HflC (stomatin/prohibitin superfamily)